MDETTISNQLSSVQQVNGEDNLEVWPIGSTESLCVPVIDDVCACVSLIHFGVDILQFESINNWLRPLMCCCEWSLAKCAITIACGDFIGTDTKEERKTKTERKRTNEGEREREKRKKRESIDFASCWNIHWTTHFFHAHSSFSTQQISVRSEAEKTTENFLLRTRCLYWWMCLCLSEWVFERQLCRFVFVCVANVWFYFLFLCRCICRSLSCDTLAVSRIRQETVFRCVYSMTMWCWPNERVRYIRRTYIKFYLQNADDRPCDIIGKSAWKREVQLCVCGRNKLKKISKIFLCFMRKTCLCVCVVSVFVSTKCSLQSVHSLNFVFLARLISNVSMKH